MEAATALLPIRREYREIPLGADGGIDMSAPALPRDRRTGVYAQRSAGTDSGKLSLRMS